MATLKVFKMVTKVGLKEILFIVKIFSGITQLLEVPDFFLCVYFILKEGIHYRAVVSGGAKR